MAGHGSLRIAHECVFNHRFSHVDTALGIKRASECFKMEGGDFFMEDWGGGIGN
jgi:hypothetical protein